MEQGPITTPLSVALELRAVADHPNRVSAHVTRDWAQGRATFGGLVAALGVRALERVSQGRTLRAFSLSFCAPTEPGELAIDLELLRSGRSLLHAQARVVQDGQVRAVLIGAYGAIRPSALHFESEPAPLGPDPASIERMPYVEGVMPVFLQHFDHRWSPANNPASETSRGRIAGFVRSVDADRVDTAVIAALTDAFPAPFVPLLAAPTPSSTASWLVNFVGEPAPIATDAFWQFGAQTLSAGSGYANVEAKLWDASGALRVVSRQLVAEFSSR